MGCSWPPVPQQRSNFALKVHCCWKDELRRTKSRDAGGLVRCRIVSRARAIRIYGHVSRARRPATRSTRPSRHSTARAGKLAVSGKLAVGGLAFATRCGRP